jgi:uncharacterized protein YhdP
MRVQARTVRTEMDVNVEARDAALFARYGVPEGVRGGTGTLEGKLELVRRSAGFHYDSLNGRFTLDVKRGQFTKVNPGIGKLLGVLNLEYSRQLAGIRLATSWPKALVRRDEW